MPRPTLQDMTAKELLNARNQARDYEYHDDTLITVGHRAITGGERVTVEATLGDILRELNTRPHVPSKKEATVLRQLKAKTKQSEEWLRAHPTYSQQLADACYPNRRVVSEDYYKRLARAIGPDVTKMYKIG